MTSIDGPVKFESNYECPTRISGLRARQEQRTHSHPTLHDEVREPLPVGRLEERLEECAF
jgi:hypothetical protein